jgi:hypothetical protein
MRKISTLATILITSFVLALAGLVASPVASASENDGGISATFAFGSSVLSDDQKAAIKKALASSGSDVSFIVTGTAGKLPGVSDSRVQRLAKARAKAIKAYLVSLGVSKASITTQVKIAEIGETPKSIGSNPTPTPTPTVTAVATASAPTAPTCATSYCVGDRGPGGGIVFYVSAANFTSTGSTCNTAGAGESSVCKYLEVAPATWQGPGASVTSDAVYVWSNTYSSDQDTTASTEGIVANRAYETLSWKIGEGFNNTSFIRDTSTAKAAVRAYAAGTSTAGQWFIPSMNELNELCKYARGQTTGDLTVPCVTGSGIFKSTVNAGSDLGGFAEGYYWSSSEYGSYDAHTQNFNDGAQNSLSDKVQSNYVRPVRAF